MKLFFITKFRSKLTDFSLIIFILLSICTSYSNALRISTTSSTSTQSSNYNTNKSNSQSISSLANQNNVKDNNIHNSPSSNQNQLNQINNNFSPPTYNEVMPNIVSQESNTASSDQTNRKSFKNLDLT